MLRSISTLAALILIQCGSPSDVADNVAARVGDKEITREDLTLFAAETPALLRSEAAGIDAAKDYLQTLIDMELMLVEATPKAWIRRRNSPSNGSKSSRTGSSKST